MGICKNIKCEIITSQKGVTGSIFIYKILYKNNELFFMVDCGITQGEDLEDGENGIEIDENIKQYMDKVKFTIITHPHADHIARLPMAVSDGLNSPIYMSTTSRLLLPTILESNLKILQEDAKKNYKKVPYNGEAVDKTIKLAKKVQFNKKQVIYHNNDLDIELTLFKNAHVVGSSYVFLEIHKKEKEIYDVDESLNIFITGDMNNSNIFYDSPEIPEKVLEKPLILVTESTYGLTKSDKVIPKFEQDILEAIKQKKKIIILVNALGKCQEVLLRLKKLNRNHYIPRIWLDGKLAITYCYKFKMMEEIPKHLKNFRPKNLKIVSEDNRKKIAESDSPSIIITTSGMGTDGPAPEYLKANLENPNALIYFTSYCAINTFGNILQEKYYEYTSKNVLQEERNIEYKGKIFNLKCSVDNTKETSTHAKCDEIVEFIDKFKNIKLCLLVHGSKEAKEAMQKELSIKQNIKSILILTNQVKVRFNPYGLEKEITYN